MTTHPLSPRTVLNAPPLSSGFTLNRLCTLYTQSTTLHKLCSQSVNQHCRCSASTHPLSSQSGSALLSFATVPVEVKHKKNTRLLCATYLFSRASRTATCTMAPGAPGTRTCTSGWRWTPSTSRSSPGSSCRAGTPSGGQVVPGTTRRQGLPDRALNRRSTVSLTD